jgi:hypothetical protein
MAPSTCSVGRNAALLAKVRKQNDSNFPKQKIWKIPEPIHASRQDTRIQLSL